MIVVDESLESFKSKQPNGHNSTMLQADYNENRFEHTVLTHLPQSDSKSEVWSSSYDLEI